MQCLKWMAPCHLIIIKVFVLITVLIRSSLRWQIHSFLWVIPFLFDEVIRSSKPWSLGLWLLVPIPELHFLFGRQLFVLVKHTLRNMLRLLEASRRDVWSGRTGGSDRALSICDRQESDAIVRPPSSTFRTRWRGPRFVLMRPNLCKKPKHMASRSVRSFLPDRRDPLGIRSSTLKSQVPGYWHMLMEWGLKLHWFWLEFM